MTDHYRRLIDAAHSPPHPLTSHQTVMLEAALYIQELEERIEALRTGFTLVIEQAAEMVGRSSKAQK